MRKITLLLFTLMFCLSLNAQVLTENFDATGAPPAGWTTVATSGASTWTNEVENESGNVTPRSGAGMGFYYSGNYNGDMATLETPSMDLSTLPPQVLTFYFTQETWGGDQDELRVYYKTSAAGALNLLAEYTAHTPNWTEVNIPLPNPSADYYVVFEGTSGYGYGVTIDDLVIDNAPNCLTPGSLSVFATSPTTADLSWVPGGSETTFDYEYGAPGFAVETGAELGSGTVMANTAGISGLTAGTDYEFYVRADCSGTGDGTSAWAGPFAWNQDDLGESCGTAYAATLDPDCGNPTSNILLDFTGAPSNISTSCDTFNNYGLWITATTDASGGLTVNVDNAVDLAVYDTCGGADIACFNGDIFPSVDLALSPNTQYYLYFWQEGTTSTAMVDVCISSFSPAPAPDCAEAPIVPMNAATDVLIPAGELTLNWTAPSSGPAPTDYELYFGTTSGALVSLGLLGSTDTFVDLINLEFATTYYWTIVPYNGATQAVGPCAEWSFTTEDAPPPPANDDCSGAIALTPGMAFGSNPVDGTVVSATADTVTNGCGLDGPGVWYSVVVPGDGNITIETGPDAGTGNTAFDSVIEAFSGTCGALTSIECDDDDSTEPGYSVLNLSGLTGGETIYIRVWEFNGDEEEPFSISAYSATLSNDSFENENAFTYFPNPVKNELSLRAQSNIENVSVFNMLGQEVLRATPNTLEANIDTNSLAQGAYFVQVTINDVTETVRILKQ